MVSRRPAHSDPVRVTGRRVGVFACIQSGLVLLVALALGWGVAQAVPPAPQSSAADLTHRLVTLHIRYQLAAPTAHTALLRDLVAVAIERQRVLSALIETDPGEVLRVAMPAGIRAGLPPVIRSLIEEEIEVEGTLEILHEDRDQGSRYHYFLHTLGEKFRLYFAAELPTDLETGDHVRARGIRVGAAVALQSGSASIQTLAAALPNTFGAQKTLVILVNFQDMATQPYTVASAQSALAATSNFDLEGSYQQTWLTGVVDLTQAADVRGWYTIPLSSTVCDYSTLASQAKSAAAAAGVNLSAYTRYVYAFPDNACTWWGLGTVGGNPSQAWINGTPFSVKVVGHEMGHNLGLYHSRALECGTTTLGTSCSILEYGNTLDIMGNPSSGQFNAFQKERLGWLNYGVSPPVTTVQADGTYGLDALESPGSNPKALKILKSTDPNTGKKTWYYVEYRQALGFDSFLSSNSNVLTGVVITAGSESSGNSSNLLDMTPATASWSDPALDVGQTFTDPDTGVTIAPTWTDSAGASVGVTFGPMACVRANPVVTLSPSQSQWVQPGTTVTYTVSVTNKDNGGCAASDIALHVAAPSGWTAALAASALTVNPGATASTTLQVASPVSATNGFYTIGVTATNSGAPTYVASTSATYVIATSPNVSVSTDKPSYTRNQSVFITVTVTANGSPVAGAGVTVTITKPSGAKVAGSSVSGANGSVVFKYRIGRRDPVGTYQIAASVSSNNAIVGSGSASFMVQ